MEQEATWRRRRRSSNRYSSCDQRVVAICLAVVAVISPLYIDRRKEVDPELDEQHISFSSFLPLLLLVLIMAIAISRCVDRGCCRSDPNWIHRVGGSSTGIIILLLILALVLKCKSF